MENFQPFLLLCTTIKQEVGGISEGKGGGEERVLLVVPRDFLNREENSSGRSRISIVKKLEHFFPLFPNPSPLFRSKKNSSNRQQVDRNVQQTKKFERTKRARICGGDPSVNERNLSKASRSKGSAFKRSLRWDRRKQKRILMHRKKMKEQK